jgi:GR25 family glycosyltransferase involved in LPS biosynthesis
MKYILICSDKNSERKLQSIRNLNNKGIRDIIFSPSVFLDSPPNDFNDREWVSYYSKDSKYALNIIGCFLAHITAMRLSLELNDHCMIFEDDILLTNEYKNHIDKIFEVLEKEGPALFYLNSIKQLSEFTIVRKPKKFTGCYCYIINKNYARNILDYCSKYYGAIDKILHRSPFIKYQVSPKISTWFKSKSLIKEK